MLPIVPVAIVVFLLFGFGPNTLLALLAVAVLVVGSQLLWRPGESPILLFIFLFQWLQATAALAHSNWLNIELEEYALIGGNMGYATALTLGALFFLAIGARLGMGPGRNFQPAAGVAQSTAIRFYVIACAVAYVARSSAWVIPGLSQPLLALAGLKWAPYFILVYSGIVRKRKERLWVLAFVFEFLQGIGGFFSDFKTVIFFTTMAAVAANTRIRSSTYFGLVIAAMIAIAAGVVWTAVKGDYRAFVASTPGSQTVVIDYATRMNKLVELVSHLDTEHLGQGASNFVRRLSYVEFFGLATEQVPSSIPYEGGEILLDAIVRPFMPRVLFPDKSVIDDTSRTNAYTGGAAGTAGGTSISLGYVAEAYIDFGPWLMMPVLVLIGGFYGLLYRRLVQHVVVGRLWGMSAASCIMYTAMSLDSSLTKIIGGVVVNIVIVWVVNLFILKNYFPWLLRRQV